jgi:transcription initiation factor TFIID subunit TAF12
MATFAAAALASAVSTGLSAIQQHSAAKKQAAHVETQRRQQVAQVRQQQEIETKRRRQQLRQAQATQRARFAGGGIGSASGSAHSLLSGLARQVDEAVADTSKLNDLRIGGINSSAAAERSSLLSKAQGTLVSGIGDIIKMTPSLLR